MFLRKLHKQKLRKYAIAQAISASPSDIRDEEFINRAKIIYEFIVAEF